MAKKTHQGSKGSTVSAAGSSPSSKLTPAQKKHLAEIMDEPSFTPDSGFLWSAAQDCRPHELSQSLKTLGDYALIREVGKGGMGVVYEARQITLDRRVALKVLPFAGLLDKNVVVRFQNEARAAGNLSHPNIVPVYGVGCERGVHYYSMQFIEGQSLNCLLRDLRTIARTHPCWDDEQTDSPRDAVSKEPPNSNEESNHVGETNRPLSSPHISTFRRFSSADSFRTLAYLREIARLIADAADGLHHAHQCGVIHRDIKPSNLLLDFTGKLWITDFGLARCLAHKSLTRTGQPMGTCGYMSPEQALGDWGLIDQRTDVYSLGVTLYELLTLRPAFPVTSFEQFRKKIENDEPIAPRRINPAIPADLETIVLTAIAKCREDRYRSAAAMAQDLQRFLSHKPIEARRPSWLDRAFKWSRRHKSMVASAAAILILAVSGLTVTTVLLSRKNLETQRAWAQQERDHQQLLDVLQRKVALLKQLDSQPKFKKVLLDQTLADYRRVLHNIQQDGHTPSRRTAMLRLTMAKLLEEAGDYSESLFQYEAARKEFEELSQRNPAAIEFQSQAAICRHNQGLLQVRQGRIPQAIQSYRQALALQTQILQTSANPEHRHQLTKIHLNLGLALARHDDMEQAVSAVKKGTATAQQLRGQFPYDYSYAQTLAKCYHALAVFPGDSPEELKQRKSWCEQAIAVYEVWGDSQNSLMEVQVDLGNVLNTLAALELRLGDSAAAETALRRAMGLHRQVYVLKPNVVDFGAAVSASQNNLGKLLCQTGRYRAAADEFLAARLVLVDLIDRNQQSALLRSRLGGVTNNLGLAWDGENESERANTAFQQAIVQQQYAVRLDPGVKHYRALLENHFVNYEKFLQNEGDTAQAERVARHLRELRSAESESTGDTSSIGQTR